MYQALEGLNSGKVEINLEKQFTLKVNTKVSKPLLLKGSKGFNTLNNIGIERQDNNQ